MRIEIVGTNADVPVSARVNVTGVNGRRKRTVVMTYVIILSLSLSLHIYIYICMHINEKS